MMATVRVCDEHWPIRGSFTISRGTKTDSHVVVVEIERDGITGRGECVPYARYAETVAGVTRSIEDVVPKLQKQLDREALQTWMPAGAARNALDCALWDLEAKTQGCRAWQLAGFDQLMPVETAFTLSLASPSIMRDSAVRHAHLPLLKLKLGGPEDLERCVMAHPIPPSSWMPMRDGRFRCIPSWHRS